MLKIKSLQIGEVRKSVMYIESSKKIDERCCQLMLRNTVENLKITDVVLWQLNNNAHV